ncbi:hypothetical protein EKK58_11030 [Candidatus Dependentiae bacterium]|nr:MAG: hypothetical protein EKK58_11030 [Candidatus Dependentiae bacterium]
MNLIISTGDEEIVLEHHTCKVYRFRKMPELDHVYYQNGSRYFYVFNCDTLLDNMEANGYQAIVDDYPSDNDYDAYVRHTASHVDEELEELDGN